MTKRLPNDCFALPPGVDWTPVDTALERAAGSPPPGHRHRGVWRSRSAAGRYLAADVTARRANPATSNSAVDGYGFARAGATETMRLMEGRAAAGAPFGDSVPAGAAVRILTGAPLPEGVDTVAMQEDADIEGDTLILVALPRAGANTRKAGEDMKPGDPILSAGHRLRPQDVALLAAAGHSAAPVRERLRVAVLSTGDEIRAPGEPAAPHQVYDANRPMLLAQIAAWGFVPVDLGHAADMPGEVRARLDRGSAEADVILTSGGALDRRRGPCGGAH